MSKLKFPIAWSAFFLKLLSSLDISNRHLVHDNRDKRPHLSHSQTNNTKKSRLNRIVKKFKFPVTSSIIFLSIIFLNLPNSDLVRANESDRVTSNAQASQETTVINNVEANQEKTPHWGYGGAENPTEWGKLSPEFAACENGKNQSPIDIHSVEISPVHQAASARIKFYYQPTPLEVVNNGHTVQVNYAEGSSVTIDGQEYKLKQFHFHTPSEHTVKGKSYAMEAHLVHQNQKGEYAVIALFIEPGEENKLMETVWENIPETGKVKAVNNVKINVANFLPKSESNYHYVGSLTTPPCHEGVNWYIFREPIQASREQINQFNEIYSVNSRPVQPINNRHIEFEG